VPNQPKGFPSYKEWLEEEGNEGKSLYEYLQARRDWQTYLMAFQRATADPTKCKVCGAALVRSAIEDGKTTCPKHRMYK